VLVGHRQSFPSDLAAHVTPLLITIDRFVYFEEVDEVDRVRLRVELRQAATGARLGAIAIPFVVD
jgi:hypothetical protein